MRITHKNLKQGEIKVLVETLDDLWYLSRIIDSGDKVQGKTVRKIKVNEEADSARRYVFLAIKVDQVEFSKTTSQLRVGGTVLEAPEDIPRGSHHTFAVEEGTTITIIKEHWNTYHLHELESAQHQTKTAILFCAFDREEALFSVIKGNQHETLAKIKANITKKRTDASGKENLFELIVQHLFDYVKRFAPERIILASPAFWKDEIQKVLPKELKTKSIFAVCSGPDETAMQEVLSREDISQALKDIRASQEAVLIEQLLTAISKTKPSAYGLISVEKAVQAGAVEQLLVSDKLIQTSREQGRFARIEAIMKLTEQTKGTLHIIHSQHSSGKKLDGLGGIGALLRYALE